MKTCSLLELNIYRDPWFLSRCTNYLLVPLKEYSVQHLQQPLVVFCNGSTKVDSINSHSWEMGLLRDVKASTSHSNITYSMGQCSRHNLWHVIYCLQEQCRFVFDRCFTWECAINFTCCKVVAMCWYAITSC